MKKRALIGLILAMVIPAMGMCIDEAAPTDDLPWYCDRLLNTSNLSDADIWSHIQRLEYRQLRDALDLDGDDIADHTYVQVDEFIVRMEIIIGRKRKKAREQIRIITGIMEIPGGDI